MGISQISTLHKFYKFQFYEISNMYLESFVGYEILVDWKCEKKCIENIKFFHCLLNKPQGRKNSCWIEVTNIVVVTSL